MFLSANEEALIYKEVEKKQKPSISGLF